MGDCERLVVWGALQKGQKLTTTKGNRSFKGTFSGFNLGVWQDFPEGITLPVSLLFPWWFIDPFLWNCRPVSP